MSRKLYHGSINPNIRVLNPILKLHEANVNVVYLTDNLPYALFYIWDGKHNKKTGKHVTAWIKNGITYYEEQFSGQMEAFYNGVKGYLYSVICNKDCIPVTDRESMYSCKTEIAVDNVEIIENVYGALKEYESKGKLKVIHFEDVAKERIDALYNHMAEKLKNNRVTENPNTEEAIFYQTYFKTVWENAVRQE